MGPKNDDAKLKRVNISRTLQNRFEANSKIFHCRLVTQNETWVYYFEYESKIQRKQWSHSVSPPPKKFKQAESDGKAMASIFFHSEGVIMIDYMEKGKAINEQYYAWEL